MKRKLLLITLASLSSFAYAQSPILTGITNNPVIGDAFISITCDTTGVSHGSGGAGTSWTFTSLVPSTVLPPIDTGTVVASSSTTASPIYSSANYAIVTPTNSVMTYYSSNASKLSLWGTFISLGNFTAFLDPMDQLHFPFQYLDTFTDAYFGTVTFTPGSSAITATENGTVFVQADGYGTLTLPGTPTPSVYTGVLRVHSSQSFRDSANLFGTPTVGTYNVESYVWYQPYYHTALLTISTAVGPGVNNKVVSYASKQIANHDAVPAVSAIDASLSIFPNPSNGEMNISFYSEESDKVRITVEDMTSREIAVVADRTMQGLQNITYNTSLLPGGLYLLRLQTSTGTITRKIETK